MLRRGSDVVTASGRARGVADTDSHVLRRRLWRRCAQWAALAPDGGGNSRRCPSSVSVACCQSGMGRTVSRLLSPPLPPHCVARASRPVRQPPSPDCSRRRRWPLRTTTTRRRDGHPQLVIALRATMSFKDVAHQPVGHAGKQPEFGVFTLETTSADSAHSAYRGPMAAAGGSTAEVQ